MIYSNLSEFYVLNFQDIIYCGVDDHYTHIYYDTGDSVMLPLALTKLEELLLESPETTDTLVRVGRKYIVNVDYLVHVNVQKRTIDLRGKLGKYVKLKVSRSACQKLMDDYLSKHKEAVVCSCKDI